MRETDGGKGKFPAARASRDDDGVEISSLCRNDIGESVCEEGERTEDDLRHTTVIRRYRGE